MPLTKRCLLIDDDPDDQEIFALALQEIDRSIGYSTADSGQEALHILSDENSRPDYIFLDLNMPQMDGAQCLAEIKKLGHLNDIPVIIYTTSARPEDKNTTMQLGASDFITKPHSVTELINALSTVFQRQK